jgi:hypothetical protein
MPTAIVKRCILAGSPQGGVVFDPFSGAGTTALVADRLGRHGVGLELSAAYCALGARRVYNDAPLFIDLPAPTPNPFTDPQPELFGEAQGA